MIATKQVSGFAPIGWKVVAIDGQEVSPADNSAADAIDGKPSTVWQSPDTPMPHSITVDMGREMQIGGFSYLPRQDRNRGGVIDTYRFETSTDGKKWTAAVDQGRFANIRNNPVLQEVNFAATPARYFRQTALSEANGGSTMSAAEITVLPPKPD